MGYRDLGGGDAANPDSAYRIADAMLKDLPTRIGNGEIGAAIMVVGIKLSVAFINAAAIAG